MKKFVSVLLLLSILLSIFSYVGANADEGSQLNGWEKIEEIGNLETSEIKKWNASSGDLAGNKVVFSNMTYGVENMRSITLYNKGIASNGNDFSVYPQQADLVTHNGERVIWVDYPAAGNQIAIYIPRIVFDEKYTKDSDYRLRFKAKREKKEAIGNDNLFFYIRTLDEAGANVYQTKGAAIEPSDDYIQYDIVINKESIADNAAGFTGLFHAGGTDAFRNLYIKDIELYVKKDDTPYVVYDMPEFRPEKGMHPRVYFNKNDIKRIKENATHPENKPAYDLLLKEVNTNESGIMVKNDTDNLNERSLGIIQSKAFYYAVWGDENRGKEAIAALKNFLNTCNYRKSEYNTQGFTVFTVGAVYDWCYPLLSEEDKEFFQDMGVKVCSSMEILYPPLYGCTVKGHSAEAQLQRDQLAFAFAVSDEREDIYRNIAGRYFEEFKETREFLYKAHSLPYGSSYTTYRFQWDMLSTYMLKAVGLPDYYGPEQEKALYWLLYARRPDGSVLREGDNQMNNKGTGIYETTGTRAFWLAGNYWKNPYLKGEALRRSKGGVVPVTASGNQSLTAVEFLTFNDPSVGYDTVRTMPLSMYYPAPKGGMIARTGWNEGFDSPAVVADMKINEWWFQGHQQLDAGSFQIYYKGALATDTGYYQAGRDGARYHENEGNTVYGTEHFHNYQRRTIAHNCITVYDPNEPSQNYNGHVNDGGQLYHGQEVEQGNIWNFYKNEDTFHVGKVLGHEIGEDLIQPDYTYLKGDIAKAYGEKVPAYERSFMFLNLKNSDVPAAMIVFDRVVSKDKSFEKKWLLHGLHKPEVNGSRTIFTDTRDGYNGKLTVDTLLPKSDNLKINVIGGEGQEYLVNGVNYWAQTLKDGSNEGGGYRIEVSPASEKEQDYFLNVLQVSDANSSKEVLAPAMIESATHIGAKIADRVVMFGKEKERTNKEVSFAVSGDGNFKFTVADLTEGTWQVKKDGSEFIKIVATTDGGVGSFESTKGEFSLTYLGNYGEKVFTSTPLYSDGINIKVNSKYLYSDVEPTIINSRTMVPLRAIFEALNATVTWDDLTATATGISEDGSTTVKITRDSSTAYVNGKSVNLDSPATIVNGRFLVPVRFISESLGAFVEWDSYSKTVYITKSGDTGFENGVSVIKAVQSGDNGAGAVIDNSIDGDLSTFWAAQGIGEETAWGIYELSEETSLSQVAIAFNRGNERKYTFSIAVSSDGVNYEEVLTDAVSSGETAEYEYFKIPVSKNAKYVKYIGKGSNANAWSNVFEIVFIK
ncbi:MAG: hypothetical protein E7411_00650 [Ruminococcaceae bacterium]|nr:hypothetical protein [Oscillospiraceae bacterium]